MAGRFTSEGRRAAAAARDLIELSALHPRWFVSTVVEILKDIRARGTALYRHHLPFTYHHHFDASMRFLPIEIGCCPIDYAKATIVCRFCKLLRPKTVLEIGTSLGGMTYHIARNTGAECRIWTLDIRRQEVAHNADRMIKNLQIEMHPQDVAVALAPIIQPIGDRPNQLDPQASYRRLFNRLKAVWCL